MASTRAEEGVPPAESAPSVGRNVGPEPEPEPELDGSLPSAAGDTPATTPGMAELVRNSSLDSVMTEEGGIPRCPICLADPCMPGDREVSTTSCGHTFCESCLAAATSRDPRCPTCRAALRPLPPADGTTTQSVVLRTREEQAASSERERVAAMRVVQAAARREAQERAAALRVHSGVCRLLGSQAGGFPGITWQQLQGRIREEGSRDAARRSLESWYPAHRFAWSCCGAGIWATGCH